MFQRLLLALDGSEHSLRAADVALEMATVMHARLDILSVEETVPHYVAATEEYAREHQVALAYFQRLHDPLQRRAEALGIQVHSSILHGHEVQTLLAYATEHANDCFIIGAQGHSSIWRPFLGSTADKLVNHAPCSVLVVRTRTGQMHMKRLLLALDGSPLSWKAFQESLVLVKQMNASLHVLSVVNEPRTIRAGSTGPLSIPPPTTEHLWSTYTQGIQERALAQAQQAGIRVEASIREGHASSTLIQAVQQDTVDLLILGATGQEHPWSTTLGGTARKVTNEAPCSLLVVRIVHTQHSVRDVMSTEVPTVTSQTPLAESVLLLVDQRVKLLVVVDEARHVQGIMTLGSLFAHEHILDHLDWQRALSTQHLGGYVSQLFSAEKVVGDVMNKRPSVVRDTSAIEAAAQWMDTQHITRLPVIDGQGTLVGLLDQADLLRYYTDTPVDHAAAQAPEEKSQPARAQMVSDATLLAVPLVRYDTPLTDVLPIIQTTPLQRAIILDDNGSAIGIIADHDILAAYGLTNDLHPLIAIASRFAPRLLEGRAAPKIATGPRTVQQAMRPKLFTATPATSIAEALHLMLVQHIKHLVVIDDEHKPLGLVDRQHLLRTLLE
jgi:nucleotide-binding universal stress UspA family protein/CBS domain-containing protein